MREILFRGKRTDCGEWVEGYLNQHRGRVIFDCCCNAINANDYYINDWTEKLDTDLYGCVYKVIPETVGQYTGLTDKNGVRIFEGDIVKGIAYSVERIGVIVWIDEIASFGVRYFKSVNSTAWENSSILRCASMGKTDEFAAEIIGNIHDNPELLEEGEGNG